MRKYIYAIALAAMLGSCTLETSDNGNLDGLWQLRSLDSLALAGADLRTAPSRNVVGAVLRTAPSRNGGSSVDMHASGVYWAVQLDLLEARDRHVRVLFRFNHTGDSLVLSNPYVNLRDSSDIKVNESAMLAPLGINSLEEHFAVKALSSGSMVLESPTLRLHFRKY